MGYSDPRRACVRLRLQIVRCEHPRGIKRTVGREQAAPTHERSRMPLIDELMLYAITYRQWLSMFGHICRTSDNDTSQRAKLRLNHRRVVLVPYAYSELSKLQGGRMHHLGEVQIDGECREVLHELWKTGQHQAFAKCRPAGQPHCAANLFTTGRCFSLGAGNLFQYVRGTSIESPARIGQFQRACAS